MNLRQTKSTQTKKKDEIKILTDNVTIFQHQNTVNRKYINRNSLTISPYFNQHNITLKFQFFSTPTPLFTVFTRV